MGRKPKFHCDVRASFAAAFSNWRRKSKIPLKQIAGDLGVSISTVNSWELGEYFPTASSFESLVEYTGLPPCKLFCVMADKCVPADCLLALQQIKLGATAGQVVAGGVASFFRYPLRQAPIQKGVPPRLHAPPSVKC